MVSDAPRSWEIAAQRDYSLEIMNCSAHFARENLTRLLVIIAAPFVIGWSGVPLLAQPTRESLVAITVGASGGDYGPVGATTTGLGLSTRIWSARTFDVHASGSYAIPLGSGSTVCFDNPCDTRKWRDEWRMSADVRRRMGHSALFVLAGVGVSWSRVTGEASQAWKDWGSGSRQSPLGLGQIGIGLRSRQAKHSRWLEAGLEHQAAAVHDVVFLRAGLGVL